jgi:hypothetical protein
MRILCHLLAILFAMPLFSQDKVSVKFDQITPGDFIIRESPVIDSNTNAVILSSVGSTNFIGNERHWFSYVFKKHVRIKILNEKALNVSNVKIRLYGKDQYKDKLSDLKATTYNLENGKITATELNSSDVFEDKLSSYTSERKFTLPSAKAGSIIDYSFTITSYRAYSLPTWFFQNLHNPCLYSEYKVVFPNALRYVTARYGLDSFVINKASQVKNNHYTMGELSVVSNDIMNVWAMKDIPAVKSENFINSPSDYTDKIEFVLAQAYNGRDVEDQGTTWEKVTEQLVDAPYFASAIDNDHSSNLFNTADKITSGSANIQESAHKLYYYVRDNFTCLPDNEIFLGDDLYTINKKKKGNVAEINLLLAALLRQKGISADPVILSTIENGKSSADYPLIDKMNYVICMARFGNDTVYLDATRPELGFGNLSIDCYNGHARIISRTGGPIYFYPEKIKEQKNTSAIIFNDQNGKLGGSLAITEGVFGSEKLRQEIKSSGQKKYLDDIKSTFTTEIDVSNTSIDSLQYPEFPATLHFEFKVPLQGDIIYFNPVIESDYYKNPFESGERKFPVTLPLPIDNMYTLNMEIPEGYTVDELPKSSKVAYNGDEGFFEYIIQKEDNRIQFRSHIKLNEIVFPAEDYNSLRDFFAFVIKKYNEQIVFKKKK